MKNTKTININIGGMISAVTGTTATPLATAQDNIQLEVECEDGEAKDVLQELFEKMRIAAAYEANNLLEDEGDVDIQP
jgi:hypothetical protein